jgi:hypothetical protein
MPTTQPGRELERSHKCIDGRRNKVDDDWCGRGIYAWVVRKELGSAKDLDDPTDTHGHWDEAQHGPLGQLACRTSADFDDEFS